MSTDETKPFFLNELELLKLANGNDYFTSLVAFINTSFYDKIRDNTITLDYLRSLNIDLRNFISQELKHPASTDTQAVEYLRSVIDEVGARISLLENGKTGNGRSGTDLPETLEELFHRPNDAAHCLGLLRELDPPLINGANEYIGKSKGIFPLWIKVLRNNNPSLIKHFPDVVYKNLLNKKITNLNLSKDASEFRKEYQRIRNRGVEVDLKAKLSQLSQSGKLGK